MKNAKLKPIPKFLEEKLEQAFWEGADRTDYMDWFKAKTAAFVNLKPSTTTISIRLPQSLLDSIKLAANARDVPYQPLIKVWLLERVRAQRCLSMKRAPAAISALAKSCLLQAASILRY